ncbi:hypothetical protein [Mycobacterium sp.]|uniref:hypothetical protein n=1 Tax=Mycobacterium sp. TaxID=1785 RepID=UPI002C914534|nr:hypothetical protein [Mycobacterium sp.]HTQ21065.1 hypothetical protein [Mycobacterium sp.]
MSVAQHGVPGPQPEPLPGTMTPAGAAAPPAGPLGYDQRSAPRAQRRGLGRCLISKTPQLLCPSHFDT